MGFGPLRVINEDQVVPGRGFDTHSHQDMEIISYVLSGTMAHKDSLGTGAAILPGDVQLDGHALSAADGVAIEGPHSIAFTAQSGAELLLFDMAF